MKATVAVVAAFIAFWGFVLWVSDAFAPWELVSILGVVGVVSFFGWAICRMGGLADERLERDRSARAEWTEWDRFWHEDEDTSTVRNPGLGR